jgi:hypothetical protein
MCYNMFYKHFTFLVKYKVQKRNNSETAFNHNVTRMAMAIYAETSTKK